MNIEKKLVNSLHDSVKYKYSFVVARYLLTTWFFLLQGAFFPLLNSTSFWLFLYINAVLPLSRALFVQYSTKWQKGVCVYFIRYFQNCRSVFIIIFMRINILLASFPLKNYIFTAKFSHVSAKMYICHNRGVCTWHYRLYLSIWIWEV